MSYDRQEPFDRRSQPAARWQTYSCNTGDVQGIDWDCKICAYRNYAGRSVCRNCCQSRADSHQETRTVGFPAGSSSSDWTCQACPYGAKNFGYRVTCFRCKSFRPPLTPPRRVVLRDSQEKRVYSYSTRVRSDDGAVYKRVVVSEVTTRKVNAAPELYKTPPPPICAMYKAPPPLPLPPPPIPMFKTPPPCSIPTFQAPPPPCTVNPVDKNVDKNPLPKADLDWIRRLEERFGTDLGLSEEAPDGHEQVTSKMENKARPKEKEEAGKSRKQPETPRSPKRYPDDEAKSKKQAETPKRYPDDVRKVSGATKREEHAGNSKRSDIVRVRSESPVISFGGDYPSPTGSLGQTTESRSLGQIKNPISSGQAKGPRSSGQSKGQATEPSSLAQTTEWRSLSQSKGHAKEQRCSGQSKSHANEPSSLGKTTESRALAQSKSHANESRSSGHANDETARRPGSKSLARFDRRLRAWLEANHDSDRFFDQLEDQMLMRSRLKQDSQRRQEDDEGDRASFQPRSKRQRVLTSEVADECDQAEIIKNLDKLSGKRKEEALKRLGIREISRNSAQKHRRYENGVEVVTLDDNESSG